MGHADTLLAMGGAFVAAALLARLGGRIGLPTIPLFMLAGLLLGPHTPGPVLVEDAHDFEMLSALGLVLLLFCLGANFRSGRPVCVRAPVRGNHQEDEGRT